MIPKVDDRQAPAGRTRRHRAVFTFSADVPGSPFFCKFDGQATYRHCTSPTKLSGLGSAGTGSASTPSAPTGATGVPAVFRFRVLRPKLKAESKSS